MTTDDHNASNPDVAPIDAEDYPEMGETVVGSSHGAGDAETELVPTATAAEPAHAWSTEEPATEALSRPWGSVWVIAGVGLLCAVVVAFAIFGVVAMMRDKHGVAQTNPATPTHSASALAPGPSSPAASPQATRPDDDEFVAVAISPRAIGTPHVGGFGTSGTQDRANQIALSECRADTGNDDCLTVNAGMFHGCVSYAIDSARRNWGSGAGVDAAAARAAALGRLSSPASSAYTQCSDPPGILRSQPPAPPVAEAVAPAPAPPAPAPPPTEGSFAICPSGHTGVATTVTSCVFADNVRRAYLAQGGPDVLAYSPVTEETYAMECISGFTAHLSDGQVVQAARCSGGNNAVVVVW